MTSLHGIPLLSGPSPTVDPSDACRKCNKEFNFLFTRSRKCNHCGYSYCHSCSDFQALMPRPGPESGYDPVHVCGYCIEFLNMTAAGPSQLRGMSLSKLKLYADSYNIDISRAVEKGDIVEAIVRARLPNGCLPSVKEDYYRKHKVPNLHAGARPRSFFSRNNPADSPPPVPPRPQGQPGSGSYRYGPTMDDIPNISPPRFPQPHPTPHNPHQSPGGPGHPPPPFFTHQTSPYPTYQFGRPTQQAHYHQSPPYNTYQHQPPPPPPQETRPPPPPRPNTTTAHRPPPPPRPQPTAAPQTPPRQRTTSTPPRPATQPQTSVLKNILFTNHVNASMILEKSELVSKVMTLVEDEKRERERQRMAEEAERLEMEERRREREEAIRREQEEKRRQEEEERLRNERRRRHRTRSNEPAGGGQSEASTSASPPKTSATTTPQKPFTSSLDRSGLCVICQDEEANIAIVDCGHLAMCRSCSELIMASSKECPLCRTRIVTEARLLRIFKS
ncbi:E3 ubiquitin-protein ligase cblA [Leucoagaricus sp. SymC.cos]|nr:E3 ubiquitin-protein ligase cblA [Leucoagaricus sp. SymC.cos]